MAVDDLLDNAHGLLARDLSGRMTTNAITDDIETKMRINKVGVFIMFTAQANVRLPSSDNVHTLPSTMQEALYTGYAVCTPRYAFYSL